MIDEVLKFLLDPWMWALTIISWSLAITLFVLWRERRNSYLVYSHLFFLFVPLFFFARALECGMNVLDGLLAWCTIMISEVLVKIIPFAIMLAFVFGYFIMPLV